MIAAPEDQEQLETDPKRLVEAILFSASKPMRVSDIEALMEEECDVKNALQDLEKEYESRGINLVQRDSAWAFRTAEDLAGHFTIEREEPRKLSKAALETLSIIAYHQPVTRTEIENIRGVATSKGTVDALLETGWIKPGKRREVVGRPVTWVTTTDFLDHFNLTSIMDLPGLDELKASGMLDRRPAIDSITQGAMEGFTGQGEIFEGEDEGDEEEENEE